MELEYPKDLEGIFLNLVNEFNLSFELDKSSKLEYCMEAKYTNKKGPDIGFSSNRKHQYLSVVDEDSNQYLTLFLLNNKLTTMYFYSKPEDLNKLYSLGENKNIVFLRLCKERKEEDKINIFNLKGIALRNQKFNYDETKSLLSIFLSHLDMPCIIQSCQYN